VSVIEGELTDLFIINHLFLLRPWVSPYKFNPHLKFNGAYPHICSYRLGKSTDTETDYVARDACDFLVENDRLDTVGSTRKEFENRPDFNPYRRTQGQIRA
jgi:hypothetical protein